MMGAGLRSPYIARVHHPTEGSQFDQVVEVQVVGAEEVWRC